MTKEEMNNWLKDASLEDLLNCEYDECSNLHEIRIYLKDSKLFSLNFHNNSPNESYVNGKGYIRGEYAEPIEVQKKTREIVETYYESI